MSNVTITEFVSSDMHKSYVSDIMEMSIESHQVRDVFRCDTLIVKLKGDLRSKEKVIQLLNILALNEAIKFESTLSSVHEYKVVSYKNAIKKITDEYSNSDMIHVNSMLKKKVIGKNIAERLKSWVTACRVEQDRSGVYLTYPVFQLTHIDGEQMKRIFSESGDAFSNEHFEEIFKNWPYHNQSILSVFEYGVSNNVFGNGPNPSEASDAGYADGSTREFGIQQELLTVMEENLLVTKQNIKVMTKASTNNDTQMVVKQKTSLFGMFYNMCYYSIVSLGLYAFIYDLIHMYVVYESFVEKCT